MNKHANIVVGLHVGRNQDVSFSYSSNFIVRARGPAGDRPKKADLQEILEIVTQELTWMIEQELIERPVVKETRKKGPAIWLKEEEDGPDQARS